MPHTNKETLIEVLELSSILNEEKLLISMGVPKGKPVKKRLYRHISEALDAAAMYAKPKLIWKIGPTDSIRNEFGPSRRLDRYLKSPESTALVAGTAGPEWEKLIHSNEDPMKAYVLNVAATALARDTHSQARRELAHRYPNLSISESISPGTAALPLKLQADLIRQLPIEKIGLRFDVENLFMQPLASITAIIGFGAKVERSAPIEDCDESRPRCPRCPDSKCTLRVMPFQPEILKDKLQLH